MSSLPTWLPGEVVHEGGVTVTLVLGLRASDSIWRGPCVVLAGAAPKFAPNRLTARRSHERKIA